MPAFASKPLVLGHRGAREQAPENTLPALRRALALGAHGVELDVRLSRDDRVMVIHDALLERTTNGQGPLDHRSYAELKELDAGAWFGPDFEGTALPTLEEALQLLSGAALINVELKGSGLQSRGLERRVWQCLCQGGMAGRVILSSFSPLHLWRLRRLDREIALGWLHESGPLSFGALLWARLLRLQALHPSLRTVSAGYVQRAQRQGLRVLVWTVNEKPAVLRLAGWGVDGIITDRPGQVRQWLQERRNVSV
ncbi:MAG: glycerophosphodiester phosphodiesterase [Chloroflexia bacterium]|nr:glycerophosphodiester phosphodiesterase [Chloroflexia bacterium]